MASSAEIEKLIEAHCDKAYAAAFRLTGNRADAGDLVQETFLRVMKKGELYDPAFDFGGWVYRILFRVYLNGRRARERRREVPLETEAGQEGSGTPGHDLIPEDSPEKIMEGREVRGRVALALAALPPDMRACVVLVDVERRGYGEAADILNWPVGSVAGRLFRARKLLRESLAAYEGVKI